MTHAESMIQTHPLQPIVDQPTLVSAIEALYDCAQTCTSCADACLGEEQVAMLRRCIRTCLDCADICDTTGRLLSRQTETSREMLRAQLQACVTACQVCGAECEQHAGHHEHCRICAEACRQCEQACNQVLSALAA